MEYRDILLVSEDYIKTVTNLSDNMAGDYILPSIYFAQHQYLEEILGTALVRKIQMLIAEDTINYDENKAYKELLDDYIQDYLAYTVMVEAIVATSFKINNFGASRTDDEKQYGMSFNEVFNLKDHYKSKSDYLQYRMQRFILANYSKYPELATYKSLADLQQNLYSAANVPIFLGGARNKGNLIPTDRGEYLRTIYNFPSSDK